MFGFAINEWVALASFATALLGAAVRLLWRIAKNFTTLVNDVASIKQTIEGHGHMVENLGERVTKLETWKDLQ